MSSPGLLDTPRWTWIRDFVSAWGLQAFDDSSGWSAEEIDQAAAGLRHPLPQAVREWYSFAGRYFPHGFALEAWAQVVLSDFDAELLEPGENPFAPFDADEQGIVLLYEHQQACGHALVRWENVDQEDPPVHEARGVLIADSVGEFMRTVFLNRVLEAGGGVLNGVGVRALVRSDAVARAAKSYCDVIELRSWSPAEFTFASTESTTYLSCADVVARLEGDWLWVAARTEAAWSDFEQQVLQGASAASATWRAGDTAEAHADLLDAYWDDFYEKHK